jgi:CRP-like cAMP-binding protein
MRGGLKPHVRRVKAGRVLVEQGSDGEDVFLLLDGVLVLEVNGEALAELGPGAVLGERAALEGGRRTATLRAVTDCRIAAVPADGLDVAPRAELASRHRREATAT